MKLTIDIQDDKLKEVLDFMKKIESQPIPIIDYPMFPALSEPLIDKVPECCKNCGNYKKGGVCHCALPSMSQITC